MGKKELQNEQYNTDKHYNIFVGVLAYQLWKMIILDAFRINFKSLPPSTCKKNRSSIKHMDNLLNYAACNRNKYKTNKKTIHNELKTLLCTSAANQNIYTT
jgi:hypothetical protein